MPVPRDRIVGGGLVALLAVLVAIGLWKTSRRGSRPAIAVTRQCTALMGTSSALAAAVDPADRQRAEELLAEAERSLRESEALMSNWLDDSEISRLSRAPAGELVPLSPPCLEVLRAAREAHRQTGGAFDVTCRPLLELWQAAARRRQLPSPAEIARAREASSWQLLELRPDGVVKRRATTCVDLGGIAKGYAIDRAAAVLAAGGLKGGMVDVGGDLRCFGLPPRELSWPVRIKDPFGRERLATLRIPAGAVCTSGDYARFVEIGGRRLSHIVDPRSGWPVEEVHSATVIAADALTADVWATALSVLGPEGFDRLPCGVEALLVTGRPDQRRVLCTPGARTLLEWPLPEGLTIVDRPLPPGPEDGRAGGRPAESNGQSSPKNLEKRAVGPETRAIGAPLIHSGRNGTDN